MAIFNSYVSLPEGRFFLGLFLLWICRKDRIDSPCSTMVEGFPSNTALFRAKKAPKTPHCHIVTSQGLESPSNRNVAWSFRKPLRLVGWVEATGHPHYLDLDFWQLHRKTPWFSVARQPVCLVQCSVSLKWPKIAGLGGTCGPKNQRWQFGNGCCKTGISPTNVLKSVEEK